MTRTTFAGALSCLVLAGALCGNDAPQGTSTQAQETKPTTRKSLREDPANPVALIKTNHGDVYVELFVKEAPKTVGNFLDLASGRKEFTVARPPTPSIDAPKPERLKRPFYDGLTFHRVIKGFMIQGGCPLGNGTGGPGYKFEDEINATALGLDKLKAFKEPVKGEQDPKKRGGPHPWLLIRSRRDFEQRVLMPIVKKLGIKTQKEFEDRFKEVKATLLALTLKEAFENQGYRYDDKRESHKPVRGCLAMANSGPNTNGCQFFINLVDTPHLTGKHTVFGKVIKGMDIVDKIGAVPVGMGDKPTKPVTILSIRKVDYPAGPSGR